MARAFHGRHWGQGCAKTDWRAEVKHKGLGNRTLGHTHCTASPELGRDPRTLVGLQGLSNSWNTWIGSPGKQTRTQTMWG